MYMHIVTSFFKILTVPDKNKLKAKEFSVCKFNCGIVALILKVGEKDSSKTKGKKEERQF